MDRLAHVLSEYAVGVTGHLDEDVSGEVVRRVLDVVGIALGSLDEPAALAARRYVFENGGEGPALVWGTPFRTSVPASVIANGTAVRCLDLNDGYMGRDGSHPSDVIPGIVATGERYRCSGRDVAVAIAVAYEVILTLSDAMSIRPQGFDHVNVQALAACCGVARLMGLTAEELSEALAISAVAHVGLRQSRRGEVTMWKSIAGPHAIRNAIEACLLAQAGIKGASMPFEGSDGYLRVLGGPDGLSWDLMDSIVERRSPRRIIDSNIKLWPVGQVGQGSVALAIELHPQLSSKDNIQSVELSTFAVAAELMNDGPERWQPTTRESADHSIVYATAAALLDGRLTRESYHEERLMNSGVREFLQSRVSLVVRDDYTAMYPESQPARIDVYMKNGDHLVAECRYPPGHARNRPTDEQMMAKFEQLASPFLGPRTSKVLAALENLTNVDDICRITDLLVPDQASSSRQE